jgi:NTP pyrophosphatase (non-canonical NTP hydrolase)
MKRLINAGALADKLRTRKVMSGEKAVQDSYETAMWDALNEPEVTLNTLRDEIYEDAVAHGLWNDYDTDLSVYLLDDCQDLIVDEIDELDNAIEDWANGHGMERYTEELADVIIMCMSVAGKLGIDIDAAVRRKIAYNKTRPWKHEGEK